MRTPKNSLTFPEVATLSFGKYKKVVPTNEVNKFVCDFLKLPLSLKIWKFALILELIFSEMIWVQGNGEPNYVQVLKSTEPNEIRYIVRSYRKGPSCGLRPCNYLTNKIEVSSEVHSVVEIQWFYRLVKEFAKNSHYRKGLWTEICTNGSTGSKISETLSPIVGYWPIEFRQNLHSSISVIEILEFL